MKTNMIGKSSAAMARMVGGMKNSAANAKQDGRVSEAESRIRALTREIGNLTVLMLDSKKNAGPEIKERYTAILEARKVIAAAEAEKIVTRAVCPHCGKKNRCRYALLRPLRRRADTGDRSRNSCGTREMKTIP